MKRIRYWFKLLRVKHWLKNLLVLFPLVFSGGAFSLEGALLGCAAVLAFCLASSAVYVFNDLRDVEADRAHPTKRARPLASGAVSARVAVAAAALLLAAAAVLTGLLALKAPRAEAVLAAYVLLNVGYSLGLKNVAVADVAILASGFLLRVLFGGAFCAIPVSSWLFLTVLSLSFFLALGKRRGELARHGSASRKSLEAYTPSFLDKNMYVYLGLALVFYSLWTFERIGSFAADLNLSSAAFVAGVPLAMLVCLRYSMDVEDGSSDGDPVEVVVRDGALLALVLAWAAVMLASIYLSGG